MGSNAGETDARAIDGSGQNLTEASELLRERGVPLKLELNLGNCRHDVFPVLSGSNQKNSGNLITWEHVRTKMLARNLLSSGVLDRRPPLGVQKNLIAQPIRNRRLLDGRAVQKRRNALGQFCLAPADRDGAAQGSNVIRLDTHLARQYKAANYYVKQAPNMTRHKPPHMLAGMGAPKKKPTDTRVRRVKELRVWPDGRTANDRFREAFEEWKHRAPTGERPRTEKDLERACNEIVGLPPDHEPAFVSQSMINQLKTGRVDASSSALLDVLAEPLGFRSVWIRTGAGERKPIDAERLLADLLRKVSGTR